MYESFMRNEDECDGGIRGIRGKCVLEKAGVGGRWRLREIESLLCIPQDA